MIRSFFKSSFFRQSAWMMFATLANGALMTGVQWVMLHMPKERVGAFSSLLEVHGQLSIPIAGVLAVFMQQTVHADSEEKRRQLIGTARGILGGMFVLWLIIAVLALIFQNSVIAGLKLPGAAAWWLTLFAGLAALLAPTLTGILQGEQKFFWAGSASILNGVGRFGGVLITVLWLKMGATGGMAGVFFGNLLTLLFVAWMTRWIWTAASAPPDWGDWFRRVIPLTLGLGAPTYMFTQDMLVVQQFYEEGASGAYAAPRVVGRILFFLVGPLTMVMFPKIARSAATAEKSNVLAQAVGVTALVCGGTATACTFFPELMLQVLSFPSKSKYVETAWLIPWFAWALVPLGLSNLLVNNLLARKRFDAVPWLVAVAVGYGITLRFTYWSYLSVILTLGAFSTLLFLVCVVFTVRSAPAAAK